MTAFDLEHTYLFIDGAGGVVEAPVGPDFWATIGTNPLADGTMVTVSEGQGAWPSWEMHPAGDEVLVILEGSPRLWLEHPDGRLETLTPPLGATVIVPKGVWHRAESDAKILFITYGAGTTHKPVTDADRARGAAMSAPA